MAAGLGFEPRYHAPEACVLPLDDPAKYKAYCNENAPIMQLSYFLDN